MNLPNSLTATRIFLVPLLLAVLLTGNFPHRETWGLVVFLAAAMTDFLDGYLARKRSQVTTTGKLLDPIADKLLISAALIALVGQGVAPAWIVVAIVGREFAVTGLRSIAAAEGITIDASRWGKYKMVAQVACCSFLIAGSRYPESFELWMGQILLWVVLGLALFSMVHYFRSFWGFLSASAETVADAPEDDQILRRHRKSSDALIET